MKLSVALVSLLVTMATAIDLTSDNWETETAGKTVFLKFFAPWCGHCKKLKPDWDKLMDEFSGSSTQLVADVDCTTGGKPLCEANGVKGYPTLKYGDPSNLQDYEGGRDLDSLTTFVKESLKPMCSPANIDLCDDEKKKEIETLLSMSTEDLDAKIAAEDKKIADAEKTFESEVETIQAAYQELLQDKEKTVADVKAAGLGLMKACKGAKSKSGSDEL